MKPLYETLREYRESKGITQVHIARKTGKTAQRISALEKGAIKLSADEFVEICEKGFEVSPQIFFSENVSKNEI